MSAARAASRSAKSPCARGPGLSPRFRRRRHASSAWAAAQQRRGAGDVGVRAAARCARVCARGGLGAVRRGARSPPAPRARAPQVARVCVLAVVCQAPPPACGRRAGWPRARELRSGVCVRGGFRAVRRGARVAAARDGAIRDVPSRARAEFGFSPGCRVFPGRRGPVGPHPPRAAVPVGRPQVSGSRGVPRPPPGWRRAVCARSPVTDARYQKQGPIRGAIAQIRGANPRARPAGEGPLPKSEGPFRPEWPLASSLRRSRFLKISKL